MADLDGVNREHGQGRSSSRSLRASFRESGALRIPLADAAKVHRAADLTRAKAERHHEKHQKMWVAKAYTTLLLKSAHTLSLTPPGMSHDPKVTMFARAGRMVAQKHTQRLARIENARKNLLGSGVLRESRNLQWGGESRRPTARVAGSRAESGESRSSRTAIAKIATAQDRARRRAEAHLVKHQDQWTGKRYTELTAQFGVSGGKAPKWAAPHVSDMAMDVANRSVKAKQEARLQRIDKACDSMRASGKVRESRTVGRNLALGR